MPVIACRQQGWAIADRPSSATTALRPRQRPGLKARRYQLAWMGVSANHAFSGSVDFVSASIENLEVEGKQKVCLTGKGAPIMLRAMRSAVVLRMALTLA